MSNQDPNNLKAEKLVSLLKNSHRKFLSKNRVSPLLLFFAILLAGFSGFILFETDAFFSSAIKTTVFFGLLATAAISAFLLYRTVRQLPFTAFYQNFFTAFNREETLNAVDLYLDESQKRSRFYKAALNANLKGVESKQLKFELSEFVKSQQSHKTFRGVTLFLLAGLLAFASIGLTQPDESKRVLTFWNDYSKPNPFNFTVTPADTTIEHGSQIRVVSTFEGEQLPEETLLAFKTDIESEFRYRQMTQTVDGEFVSQEIELTNDIQYRVEMDGYHSELYTVDVQLQPRFDELIAEVTPPAYTGLSTNEYEYPFSQLNFYPGSEITLHGSPNKELDQLSVRLGGEFEPMNARENDDPVSYQLQFSPSENDTLIFEMIDTDGLKNRNPYRTTLSLQEDQYPTVVIQEPTGTIFESEPGDLMIFYQATDDFGITRAELHWELQRAFVDEPQTGFKELETPRNGRTEAIDWSLQDLELRPRDQLVFHIRVWDNDEIAGYKMSESQEVVLQVPSLTESFEELDSRERDLQGEMDQISDNFRDLEQEYEEFLERLRQNPEGGFEEEQMLEDIRDRQDTIDDAVREMTEQFEELRSEMEQNENISDETRRAYQELQQLMDDLDDPALREALEELQKALESMSPQDIEEALENVDFNEQLYRERLERTAELFKRLKMNSDLDRLARQYEDLSERLQSDDEKSLDQLQKESESIREDMDTLSEQLDELDSNPPRRSEEQLRELKEESSQKLDEMKERFEQLQQDASKQMEGGESEPSEEMQQEQEQLSQDMREEAEKFRSSIQQMSGQQINVNILALQRALYTLLELSDAQEFITQTASNTPSRSQGFVELARIQKNVSNQFSIVADTIFNVSSEIPGLPNQVNRKKAEVERTLGNALDEMVERNQRGSSISSRESLGGINDLSSMLSNLIDQLMDQQDGDGAGGMSMDQMVEQLQNMTGDQQQLNEELQQMINDMQGDRLSREESERLDQLARQQNEIRRQLQELQRSGALRDGDRTLSELQRMLEDMEDSINDMRGGMTDPLMIERQQNILSRMLNAEESLQQRGEDDEREGRDVTDFDRTLPPDMTIEELEQEIRSRLQDPNYSRFSEDYQRLIERYFEQLRRFDDQPIP